MFRRRKAEVPEDLDDTAAETEALDEADDYPDPRANGPWDASEVTLDEDDENRVDLGSLVLRARERALGRLGGRPRGGRREPRRPRQPARPRP